MSPFHHDPRDTHTAPPPRASDVSMLPPLANAQRELASTLAAFYDLREKFDLALVAFAKVKRENTKLRNAAKKRKP